jgi:cellulose synthase/poly-beta-1,6-N-acetylglucosamine synthase-like glycosyltransferase
MDSSSFRPSIPYLFDAPEGGCATGMGDASLAMFSAPPAQGARRPLGQILLERGDLCAADLSRAVALQQGQDARFGDILVANDMVSEAALYTALAEQFGTIVANLRSEPPNARLVDALGADFCVQHNVVPWKNLGGGTVLICSRPDEFATIRALVPEAFGRVHLAVAPEGDIQTALIAARNRHLSRRAEQRVDASESCRDWQAGRVGRIWLGVVLALIALFIAAPSLGFALLTGWVILTMLATTGIKLVSAVLMWRSKRARPEVPVGPPVPLRLPIVSILVPLYREREIAGRLVRRLAALDYPRALLDICLVVEADDVLTRETLARSALPRWMRQIVVPEGSVRTKPRALNFALDFCRGSIIGVYDAEDAPAPDQIDKVVRRFAERGPEVACLQGILDFYNAPTNWLSRAFTIEYATWFRIVLPGWERLGFAVPLGGTTLFFRRAALEGMGGWDAHNVTEDADLGIRLARRGFRTELIDTVTKEEANCRPWPWIKQRSRWIKGYAMTYGVHMRAPRRLLAELGWRKTIGVQVLFLGTLSQFVLAPFLWSFWVTALGFSHPVVDRMPGWMGLTMAGAFFSAEIVNIAIGISALGAPEHRFLRKWVPTLHFYYPLATLAAVKAIAEIVTRPFYWDKTHHGAYHTVPDILTPAPIAPPNQA